MKNFIKITNIFFFNIILIFLFCDEYQPKGYLTGKVLDKFNSPISNVEIEISGRKTYTSDDGQFFIDKIPNGEHRLILKCYGKILKYSVKIQSDSISTFNTILDTKPKILNYTNSFGQKNLLIPNSGDVVYVSPALDGASLAVEIFDERTRGSAIWQIDLKGKFLRVLEDFGSNDKDVIQKLLPIYQNFTIYEGNPIWFPDGKKMIYQTNIFYDGERHDFHIWIIDLETGERSLIDRAFTPNLSRDGKRLLYSKVIYDTNGKLNWDIWLYNLENKRKTRITKSNRKEQYPCWGNIGDKEFIYYSALTSKRNEIWRMDSDGSNQIQISLIGNNENVDALGPIVSPDGKKIVFWTVDLRKRGVERNLKIWIMDSNGSNISVLLENGANPVWSQDGKYVYFISKTTSRYQVWRTSINK